MTTFRIMTHNFKKTQSTFRTQKQDKRACSLASVSQAIEFLLLESILVNFWLKLNILVCLFIFGLLSPALIYKGQSSFQETRVSVRPMCIGNQNQSQVSVSISGP